jgi:hypothetical protein
VFLNSPHRETPKNVKKENREKIGFGFFVDFFVKHFRHDCFVKLFRHGRFAIFLMVFLNSPCRETPKNVIKQIQEKQKVGWWVGRSGI